MSEFKAVLDANPDADIPLGNWLTKTDFLNTVVSQSIDEYIDWKNSTAHFNTDSFIQLLEFANTFPTELYTPVTIVIDGEEHITTAPGPDENPEGSDDLRVAKLQSAVGDGITDWSNLMLWKRSQPFR